MLDDTVAADPPEWPGRGNLDASLEDTKPSPAIALYKVTAQAYPPILASAGLTDPRVTYWEPAKWCAA